jgi:hypothetical protein
LKREALIPYWVGSLVHYLCFSHKLFLYHKQIIEA